MKGLTKYFVTLVAAALMSSPVLAQINFTDDFESYNPDNPAALADGGWQVFATVFTDYTGCSAWNYQYGPFVAPTGGPGFSDITDGQSGQALNAYSDYNNADAHGNSKCIETSLFQEDVFDAADDVGEYIFSFVTQVPGPLEDGAHTFGFVRVIDPNNGYARVIGLETQTVSGGIKTITVDLDDTLDGMIVQWGFGTKASNYAFTGRYYDNVRFSQFDAYDVEGVPIPPWGFVIMIGLISFVGGSRFLAKRKA